MSKPSLEASSDSSSDPLLVRHGAGSSDTEEFEGVTTTATTCSHKGNRTKGTFFALLSWYSKFCNSSSNQDKLLKVIQWSLTLLTSRPWPQKVALEISFARYVTRLLQLPVALEAAVHDSWVAKAKQRSTQQWYQWIGRILAYSMLLYYPTEHMAYVLWMQPAAATNNSSVCPSPKSNSRYPWIPAWKAEKWSYWSCRCWCAYIIAELAQNMLQLRELTAAAIDDEEEEDKASAITDTQLQLARNALFLFPAIHWSLPSWDTQPWLKGRTVTWLMWAEAVVSFYQGYRRSG